MRIPLEHKSPREIYNVMRRSVVGQDEQHYLVRQAHQKRQFTCRWAYGHRQDRICPRSHP